MNITSRRGSLGLHSFGTSKEVIKAGVEDIKKSATVSDALASNYGGDPLKFKKSGKEIKAKLVLQREREVGERDKASKDMESYLSLVDNVIYQPTQNMYESNFKGTKSNHSYIPKLFTYDQIRKYITPVAAKTTEFSNIQEVSGDVAKEAGPTMDYDSCPLSKYNRAAECFVESNTEILLIDTLLNNLKDNVQYPLTVKQAASIGF